MAFTPDYQISRPPRQADLKLIEQAVNIIMDVKAPILMAGDGVYWANAEAELLEFVELLGLPAGTRRLARAAVREDHQYGLK